MTSSQFTRELYEALRRCLCNCTILPALILHKTVSSQHTMSIKVLINPESGSVNTKGVSWLKDHIAVQLKAAGYTADYVYGGALDLQLHAQACIEKQSVELFICAGGDGTVAAVAQSLVGTGVPLLPLPGGTMNLFVRDLRIPDALDRALGETIYGQPKTIDVGLIDDRVFINNVVFGAYAEIADAREDLRDADTATQTMEAVANVADAVFSADPQTYRIMGDRISEKIESNVLMIANNAYTGADLLRPIRKRIDQGKLGVYIAESSDGPDLIMRIAEVLAGRLKESPSFHLTETSDCIVSSSLPMRVAIDGDPVEKTEKVRVKTIPRAITVIVPQPNGNHELCTESMHRP
ncbi:MAG: diacylglycerol kinase family protein [Pseudomonadota bacterium]